MNITQDGWTPLLNDMSERFSPDGRRRLLFQAIGELQDVSMLNFGQTGLNRPSEWPQLSASYALRKHAGDRTPTLILTGALRDSFVHTFNDHYATLTNIAEYAEEHQFGDVSKNLPARPFYPVTADGSDLTEFAKARLVEVLDAHFQIGLSL